MVYAVVTEGSNGKLVIGAKPADALGNVYAQVVKAYTNADGTKADTVQEQAEPVQQSEPAVPVTEQTPQAEPVAPAVAPYVPVKTAETENTSVSGTTSTI